MASNLPIFPAGSPDNPDAISVHADPKLIALGWVRKHLVDAERARESIELFTSMGYDVKAQKLTPADFGPDCQECASVVCRSYVLIYTRKKESSDGAGGAASKQ